VSACLFVLAVFYYLKSIAADNSSQPNHLPDWLPMLAFLCYICTFMIGYGSVSWVVFAELLPVEVRSMAFPLGLALMWAVNFVLTTPYSLMLETLDYFGTLWFFSALCFVGVIFVAVFVPETKDKTPEEIARHFRPRNRWPKLRKLSANLSSKRRLRRHCQRGRNNRTRVAAAIATSVKKHSTPFEPAQQMHQQLNWSETTDVSSADFARVQAPETAVQVAKDLACKLETKATANNQV